MLNVILTVISVLFGICMMSCAFNAWAYKETNKGYYRNFLRVSIFSAIVFAVTFIFTSNHSKIVIGCIDGAYLLISLVPLVRDGPDHTKAGLRKFDDDHDKRIKLD